MDILEHHVSFQPITIKKRLDYKIPFSAIDVNKMCSGINNLAENAVHALIPSINAIASCGHIIITAKLALIISGNNMYMTYYDNEYKKTDLTMAVGTKPAIKCVFFKQ